MIVRSESSGGPCSAPIVMCDGVFASLGSIAPVTEYLDVLDDYSALRVGHDDTRYYAVIGPSSNLSNLQPILRNDLIAYDRVRDVTRPETHLRGTPRVVFGSLDRREIRTHGAPPSR